MPGKVGKNNSGKTIQGGLGLQLNSINKAERAFSGRRRLRGAPKGRSEWTVGLGEGREGNQWLVGLAMGADPEHRLGSQGMESLVRKAR